MSKTRFGVLILLFLLFTAEIYVQVYPSVRIEYEIVSQPSYIRDGDTFEIPNSPAIRLADVSCPETYEYGGSEATYALTQMIDGETVYIDVDDVYGTGPYGRYICLVYVDYNSTHFLNVNLAMVTLGKQR
ncbi:MAG: thermonuclease family protein [Candidatus Bathyarchaeota archaeon]|nr:thermonuclease family protein [Candidatus Bathyarchaeota archaeon]